jgi:hypothetical protein
MVKQMTKGANTLWSLSELLQKLNPVLRDGEITIAFAPARAVSSLLSTSMSGTASGVG